MKSRTLERRMRCALHQSEPMVEADRRFFERWPERQHRLRLAHKSEVEAHAAAGTRGGARSTDRQDRVCVAVRKISALTRLRALLLLPAALCRSLDSLSESECRRLYETVKRNSPDVDTVEATAVMIEREARQ